MSPPARRFPETVSAILDRVQVLKSALIEHQQRADACREGIRHINFVIAYCDWDVPKRNISRRYTTHARHLKSGFITRLAMTALRRAEGPITAREILRIVSEGLRSKSTKIGQRRLDNAIRSSLKCKEREGIVISERPATGPQTFRIVLPAG